MALDTDKVQPFNIDFKKMVAKVEAERKRYENDPDYALMCDVYLAISEHPQYKDRLILGPENSLDKDDVVKPTLPMKISNMTKGPDKHTAIDGITYEVPDGQIYVTVLGIPNENQDRYAIRTTCILKRGRKGKLKPLDIKVNEYLS